MLRHTSSLFHSFLACAVTLGGYVPYDASQERAITPMQAPPDDEDEANHIGLPSLRGNCPSSNQKTRCTY